MKNRNMFLLAGLISCIFLSACGIEIEPNKQIPSEEINGTIKGRVLLGNDGWVLDLTTGLYSKIKGMELWGSDRPDYLGIAQASAFPVAYSGLEIIETVRDCRNIIDKTSNSNCIKIYNQDGDILEHLNYNGRIITDAKPSRNAQYIALARQYGDLGSNSLLEIHDRSGSLVSSSVVEDNRASITIDWLPDNILVYTFKQSIFMTTALSTTGIEIFSFPLEQGTPDKIAASPDGLQLAFQLRTNGSFVADHGHIWVINIDGSGLRQLTNVPDDDNPVVNYPAWSPDGHWILVVEGRYKGSNGTGGPGTLYAVPSDGEKVLLTIDSSTSAKPILSYNDMKNGKANLDLTFDYQSAGNHAWLP